MDLRQKIQKQLNRVELGQKPQEAVFFGRKGKLYVGDDVSITGISVSSLGHWEIGDRSPHGPALVLLNVVAKETQAVLNALSA